MSNIKPLAILSKCKGRVTILGSGPSSNNYSITTDTVIIPNRSICASAIKGKQVIWVLGSGTFKKQIVELHKDFLLRKAEDPQIIVLRCAGNLDKYQEIYNLLKSETNATIVYIPVATVISTGAECVKIALLLGYDNLQVAGIEMGVDTTYSQDILNNNLGLDSGKRHLNEDKAYFNTMDTKEKRLIHPVENSGLYTFLGYPNA